MQTLLAFAFDHEVAPERVQAGLDRVERWYRPWWPARRRRDQARTSGLGLLLWDDPDDECHWPGWARCGDQVVATLGVPLGFSRLVGAAPLPQAPVALARRLQHRPSDVLRLTPAFVLATLDERAQSLTLLTDGLGLGRLYEVRTGEGRFWSNRPVAALVFAGLRAEVDPTAWRQLAACDWAMGASTPYRGVRTIGAGTRIWAQPGGHSEQSLDVLQELLAARRDPLTPESVAVTADALTALARETRQLWDGVPVLSLSGGRDSRLVVAAYLAAGVEVRLRTYDDARGEAETARLLVRRLNRPVEHLVSAQAGRRGRPPTGAYARARQWHDVTEGLRPSLYLRSPAPRRLLRQRPALICGVGGEFGHAPGYPDDVERLERLPVGPRLDAFARALQAKIVLPRGLSPRAVAAVDDQVRRVLGHAVDRGAADAKSLDWFYADERLRRWGMAGESFGRVLPLLAPEFVSAALGLTTTQSRDSALHTALIERLVPQWRGVPYYSATLRERQAVRRPRLWESEDVDLLSGVLADATDWGDAFDVTEVRSVWRAALAGRAAARDELLLQRVIWRAAFTDHLAAVNGEPERLRLPVTVGTHRPRAGTDLGAATRTLAALANDVPLARRLARTALGRRLRRRLGV